MSVDSTFIDSATSVDSTSAITSVDSGFHDETVKRFISSKLLWHYGVDSLTFNSNSRDHAYTTDQLTTQSCASHMIVTRAISRQAQPFQFTEHGLVYDMHTKGVQKPLRLLTKHERTDQLSHLVDRKSDNNKNNNVHGHWGPFCGIVGPKNWKMCGTILQEIVLCRVKINNQFSHDTCK